MLVRNANESDIGAAYKIPSKPKNNGRININGIRNSTCLDIVSITPFSGFPIAEKKFAEISCTPLIIIMNRNVRINLIVNSMYKASPEPNSEMMYCGKHWNEINANVDMTNEHFTASL